MAYSLLKSIAHNSFADGIYNELLTKVSRYYYFVGKVLPWNGTDTPMPVVDSYGYERDIRNEIVSVKEISSSNVAYVVPRVNWTSGQTYDIYDDQYSTEIQGINLTSGGTGYVSAPTITIGTVCPVSSSVTLNVQYYYNGYVYTVTGAGTTGALNTVLGSTIGTEYSHGSAKLTCVGTQATATCAITGGVVSSITMTYKGYGYSTSPTITFSSGTAAGTATRTSKTSLSSANYYVLSNNNIYVCIENNNGGTVFVAPTGYSSDFLATGDGYVWKYLSTVVSNDKFLTTAWMPVYTSRINQYASNGSIVNVNIDNGGSGYLGASFKLPLSTTVVLNSFYYYNGYVYKVTTAGTTGASYSGITTTNGATWTSGTVTFTCKGQAATITVSGDGTGASITPLVTPSTSEGLGPITGIQITSAGSNYSYADLSISNTAGTSAILTATLHTGLVNESRQSLAELSTLPGQILSAQKISGGFGYSSSPTVTIIGDGTGATAIPLVNSNRITGIYITNRGSGYNWANVVITDSTGLGANYRIVLAPYGGLGSDPVGQLSCKSLMLYANVSNNTNHGLTINNAYRQIGIIKDPNRLSDGSKLTSNFAPASWRIDATATISSSINEDDILTATYSGITYRFRVTSKSGSTVLLISLDNGIPAVGMQFTLSTDPSKTLTVASFVQPVVDKYSGDLLFVDNESAFVANSSNNTVLRTVINF